MQPALCGRVQLHAGPSPIFDTAHIEPALLSALHRCVPLAGGGSLVIEETEALVAIDVNSGWSVLHLRASLFLSTSPLPAISLPLPTLHTSVPLAGGGSLVIEETEALVAIDVNSGVPLAGGGSLVIEETEALVAIDVNSGWSVLQPTARQEDTFLAVNLAAARQVGAIGSTCAAARPVRSVAAQPAATQTGGCTLASGHLHHVHEHMRLELARGTPPPLLRAPLPCHPCPAPPLPWQIAVELRLRDLGGLVVIDFIDMHKAEHRRAVEEEVRRAMGGDRRKVRVGEISQFGLLELTRQRVSALWAGSLRCSAVPCSAPMCSAAWCGAVHMRPSLAASLTAPCRCCWAAGRVESRLAMLARLERALQRCLAQCAAAAGSKQGRPGKGARERRRERRAQAAAAGAASGGGEGGEEREGGREEVVVGLAASPATCEQLLMGPALPDGTPSLVHVICAALHVTLHIQVRERSACADRGGSTSVVARDGSTGIRDCSCSFHPKPHHQVNAALPYGYLLLSLLRRRKSLPPRITVSPQWPAAGQPRGGQGTPELPASSAPAQPGSAGASAGVRTGSADAVQRGSELAGGSGMVMRRKAVGEVGAARGARKSSRSKASGGVTGGARLCEERDEHTDRLIPYGEPIPEAVGPLEDLIGITSIHKLILMADDDTLAALRPRLDAELGGRGSLITSVPGMLEVLPVGASKATGLATVLDMMGLHPQQVMAAGDGENDIEMLQMVGLGVAMANAGPSVKAVADHVSSSNDHDGLAAAVERFALTAGL
ncbi:unnamed protein product, partial [Closterium sp. NIES-64]